MRRSRKFCQRGSDFDNGFFSVDKGRDDPNTAISGPTSAHQRNACRTFDCWLGNLVIFLGIRTSIARKPYSVVIFRWWGGVCTPIPSGSAHAHTHSLARAFTACLLKVVDIQVRKLSSPPKDVDCILASYIAYRSSNKTQFFQWSYMYIISLSHFTV